MIIGREKEVSKLKELYNSKAAELVALYGRRRVGKTFLIDEVFDKKICFRHSGLSPADESRTPDGNGKIRMKEQLAHFYRSLKEYGSTAEELPKSWLDAFYLLEDLLTEKYSKKKRVLIFIDEIQWLDTPKSRFLTGFEAFWNGWACHRKNIMVIVCGSSSSWVLDNVINNHGGLYNRVTYEMKLSPFSLEECERFFMSRGVEMSRYDIVQSYMMVGGIPYYLRYFEKGLSLPENIDKILFADNAVLKDEYDRLFSSLFTNPDIMKSIISAVSTKRRGLTRKEMTKLIGITDGGDLSKQLKALISGDFIVGYHSFGLEKEMLYKLIDPFCCFYLEFMNDSKFTRKKHWINIESSAQVRTWKGYAFENVCWNHVDQLKNALRIGGVITNETLWTKRGTDDSGGTQIDLIIVRNDNIVNMCEMKFYGEEFEVDKDYHITLERRKKLLQEMIPRKAVVHNTLVTTFGIMKKGYFSDFVDVITMDELFS
ncbi:MAG: ATP-binding protein [Lachnospiraceae bacterium]|nr:ATP-binding protein [Lachnospiraceae bacterium]